MIKKIIVLLLAICMLSVYMPTLAFATEADNVEESILEENTLKEETTEATTKEEDSLEQAEAQEEEPVLEEMPVQEETPEDVDEEKTSAEEPSQSEDIDETEEEVIEELPEIEDESEVTDYGEIPMIASKGSISLSPSDIKNITWENVGDVEVANASGLKYHRRKLTKINGKKLKNYDEINSVYCYCCEPNITGPEGNNFKEGDSYTTVNGSNSRLYVLNKDTAGDLTEDQDTNYKSMRKLLYYLYGGPGYHSKVKPLWEEYKDSNDSGSGAKFTNIYVMCACVAARKWGKAADDPEGSANFLYNRLTPKAKKLVDDIINGCKNDWDAPPADYVAFYYYKKDAQDIWGSFGSLDTNSAIAVKKSATVSIPSDYSLANAVYYLYDTEAHAKAAIEAAVAKHKGDETATIPSEGRAKDADKNNVKLTTDADGNSNVVEIDPGTYYAAEVSCSKYFEIDETVHKVSPSSSNDVDNPYKFTSKEKPIPFVTLTKTPTVPPTSIPGGSLAGAKYYVYYTQAEAQAAIDAVAAGQPAPDDNRAINYNGKKILFTTEEDGSTGDPKRVPAGTYWVAEIKASPGYKRDTTPRKAEVKVTNFENNPAVFESIEEPDTVDIVIKKTSANTAITNGNSLYSVVGTTFAVYSTQADAKAGTNAAATFTVGANGISETKNIIRGNYYLVETQAGTGMIIPDVLKASSGGKLIACSTTTTINVP